MEEDPTPYPDVNAVLARLVAAVRAVLGQLLVGMYLYGSLALGDFDPHLSDIDLLVVTNEELFPPLVEELEQLHARFRDGDSSWASRLEAAYVPADALHVDLPPTARFPQIEQDRGLGLCPVESGWVIQLYTLREHGVVVIGPDPRSLIAPIAADDVRRSSAVHAIVWAEQARHDPSWLTWVKRREHHAFVVLTLCRMLYSLRAGTVASKPRAARWMQEAADRRWADVVWNVVSKDRRNTVASYREVEELISLVEYVAQEYREWLASHPNTS